MASKSSAASLSDKPLKDLTVVELKDLCKERDIKGFAHKSKAKLLEMVEAAASGTSAKSTSGKPPADKSAADRSAAHTSSQPRPQKSGPAKDLKETSKGEKPQAKKTTSQAQGHQADLTSLTTAQLKQLCKDQGIKGFTRKTKQQLLELINSTISLEPSNNQPEIDVEEKQEPDYLSMDDTTMDGADSDQLYSEDFETGQIDQEESANELSSAEIDTLKEDFEEQFAEDAEETMIEVSDSLILEVLDRFDRIEVLLQRIAKNSGNS